MLKNIVLTVSYDGTNYNGWQKQKNAITIAGEIEKACIKIHRKKINVIGSSRTDGKVHSLGQVVNYLVDTNIQIERIKGAFNSVLPHDIVVTNAEQKDLDFHARYDTQRKTYEYKILNAPNRIPQMRNFTHFVPNKLDIEKMKEATKYFIGTYDFKAFCSSKTDAECTIRTIYNLELYYEEPVISIYVTGNGFLTNMVRIIVGTLINVGLNKIQPQDIKDIILSQTRQKAGVTVPPQGLTLINIEY